MAFLRLIGIQCNNLLPGQSLAIWPFFLESYIGSSPVTINDSNEVSFASDAIANFRLRSSSIYLYISDPAINDQTIFVSNDYIWDTDVVFDGHTQFQFLFNTAGKQPNYDLTLHYTLNITLFELVLNTIEGIGLKLFLFVRSLFRLAFGSRRRAVSSNTAGNDVSIDKPRKDSEIK
jgi:hypothetical protein